MKKYLCGDLNQRLTTNKNIVFITSPMDLLLNGVGFLCHFNFFSKIMMKRRLSADSNYSFPSYHIVVFTTSPVDLVLNCLVIYFTTHFFRKVIMKKIEAWIPTLIYFSWPTPSYQTRTTVAYLWQNVTPATGVDAKVRSAGVLYCEHSENVIVAPLIREKGLRTSQLYVTQATLMVMVQLFCILIMCSLTETTRGNLYIRLRWKHLLIHWVLNGWLNIITYRGAMKR